MKASLQLNLGQHLTLTPQLQQAIRLLQLSTIELRQEIQQLLETNPMLEFDSPSDKSTEETPPENNDSEMSLDIAMNENSLPKELPVDTTWEIIYPSSSNQSYGNDEAPNYDNLYCTKPSLHEHLLWQLELTPFSETDYLIAINIIDSINTEDGLLNTSLEDIQKSLMENNDQKESIDLDEIEAVLKRIQHFDPVGVGSRNLSECLTLQLQEFPSNTPYLEESILITKNYLSDVAAHNYKQLMQQLKIDQEALKIIIERIQNLDPHPGASLEENTADYILPDVLVKKVNHQWKVELNPETLPRLRINENYAALQQQANSARDVTFLKNNLSEARWFIKSLKSRHATLLKVASCIVENQKDFLELGDEAMKPLVLHNIAEQLDLHESTISRVTTQKYMHTPRGIFELKYFFSSHVSTDSGDECSSTAIRAVIKKLISAEDRRKPLSDNKIAQLLSGQGIRVARRTIAKYRDAIGISSSSERKSLPEK